MKKFIVTLAVSCGLVASAWAARTTMRGPLDEPAATGLADMMELKAKSKVLLAPAKFCTGSENLFVSYNRGFTSYDPDDKPIDGSHVLVIGNFSDCGLGLARMQCQENSKLCRGADYKGFECTLFVGMKESGVAGGLAYANSKFLCY